MSAKDVAVIHLRKNRESSIARHHPWVFSGAIDKITGQPGPGDLVRVVDAKNQPLGIGAYSPSSQIRVRMFNYTGARVDRAFFAEKIAHAIARRKGIASSTRNAVRLVYGESDRLPGLVVDQYADYLVCQFLFAGLEPHKDDIVAELAAQTGCRGIFERSDTTSRDKEGLPQATGVLWGETPPPLLRINENGLQFDVDIITGQKTGFFIDQAQNRQHVRNDCAGRTVLNCFAYTGGFSVAALKGNASHVTSIDSSAPALELLETNLQLNAIDPARHETVQGNVFNILRDYQAGEKTFDLVILDPPKFAENKNQVTKAARAYKDLALQACRLLVPGGRLVTFSCSGSIDLNLFQKITADALLDIHREGEILHYLHQGPDHPIALEFPESQYLKGLVCRVD